MHFVRTMIALVLAWSLAASTSAAQTPPKTSHDRQDWTTVLKLKPKTGIVVGLVSGEAIVGRFVSADDATLHVEAKVHGLEGVYTPRDAPRESVRRVTQLGKRASKRTAALLGAVAGLGGGLIAGGVYDANHRAGDDPGAGKLVFGLLGVLIGTAVGSIAFRHLSKDQVVYDAPCAPDCGRSEATPAS
jgi:hypothetical protein